MSVIARRSAAVLALAALIASEGPVLAQPKPATPKPAGPTVNVQDAKPSDAGPETVQIKREAMKLIDPKTYHVGLQLEPVESLALAAPMDAVVSTVAVQSGQKVDSQVEVIRLDKTELDLQVERAKADVRATTVEVRKAKAGKDADAIELAEARHAAAEAVLKLAQHRLDRIAVRTPMAAQVFRIHVVPGQVVRAGEPLVQVGNTKQLKVEIPVDRKEAAPGKTIQIKIEDQTIQAKVRDLLPLAPKFEPIRDLVDSAASAVVIIDNDKGTFSAGQTVYASLIPRNPVTEVPNTAVANTADGGRRVQVVRDDVIRDIPVQILGQIGADKTFVAGAFAERDELIASTSKDLADGTRIKMMAGPPKATAKAGTGPGVGPGSGTGLPVPKADF